LIISFSFFLRHIIDYAIAALLAMMLSQLFIASATPLY